MKNLKSFALGLMLICASFARAQSLSQLDLKPGDHIAIIGDTMADRFQHSGWMEAYIYARYPNLNLVFRNLARAGDEITIRHRSENFGSPDDWLTKVRADVIFACFGFNESFKGHAGLDQFKADLDKYLKETLAKDYSGKGHPRIVLFSPIACEKHQDPNFPDPMANNANLREYTAAMAEVAKANSALFVDLFNPSLELYAAAARQGQSLTINGIHLGDAGDNLLAGVIFKGLFNGESPSANAEVKGASLEKLRAVINDKNAEWHSRYRTIDGYNVYGGRSALAYAPGRGKFISDRNAPAPFISNYKVMQEEMSQRDIMTANRDQRVWAVAKGGDLKVDDSNLPAVTPVPTDLPGAKPDQSYVYLGGEEAIAKMTVHSHMKVNLFASEEKFPELANPVQMAWDTKGRLWVAAWKNYPERTPDSKVGDSLLMFEDTDGDGKADKVTHFIDDLNAPTGFQFYKDGVLLMQAPDLWFVGGYDGNKANGLERVIMGMDSADSHHTANSLCLDPGGATYLSDGVFHRSQVETAAGPLRNNDGAVYRFEPRTGRFETYASYGFANPHGRVWTYWGDDIITDATGNNSYFAPAFSGHIDYPAKHPQLNDFWDRPSRPCAGTGLISSRHFPEEFQGDFLNCNVISFQGIYLVKVSEQGSGLHGETEKESLVSSTDSNFRPSAVNVGPDGAIYFADWHKPLIGHMQHHLRDPNRDHEHGRIYRITYEGRPLMKPPQIDGQPIPALLELLKEPENNTRERAKIELGKHDSAQVIAALDKWAASLDKNDPAYEHNMMEALWVHQWHNIVSTDLLKRMLHSPEPHARAAAGRVLCYWRDRVPDALSLFKTLADDENPRARLEAVRDASFFNDVEAVNVALTALKHPTDYYLNYTLHETLRQLDPLWRKALAAGQPVAADNPAGLGYLLHSLSTDEVMKIPRTTAVLEAILDRTDAQDADRLVALIALAKEKQTTRVAELFARYGPKSDSDANAASSLARLLPWQLPEELKAERPRLAKLAATGGSPELRQAAWAIMALADNSFDTVWAEASKSPAALADLLNGISLLNDADFRAQAYDRVKPLVAETSTALQALAGGHPAASGRFVRIELPRQGTLTLAEVQVFSGGKNVALQGKAKQSSTLNGGVASRAIDGRTDGNFGSGTETHTAEDEDHPWWEVDLGREQPIDSVAIWNRTEEDLGQRLEGFTLTVLDGGRNEIFKQAENPAPAPSATITVRNNTISALRRAAIHAIVSMHHEPEAVFASLTGLLVKGEEVPTAAQGLRILPRASWPKTQAGTAATALVAWAKTIPASERTTQDYIEIVQFAADLAGLLPADRADILRNDLRQLRVAIFVIRTVREQMRYDTPRLVVEAGKPFELRIENDDFMPHNLVVVKPGTREKVGLASAQMKPEELDRDGRAYVPKTKDILDATRLLNPGQKEALKITAPTAEGDYEYVCTFPGHYQVMWGQLIITRDVDAYLRAHPEVTALPSPAAAGAHDHHHPADE